MLLPVNASMSNYLLQRLLFTALSLLGATFIAFTVSRLLPGDPLRLMVSDQDISSEVVEAWKARYGLDQPILTQYLLFLRNAFEGDFGTSYHYIGMPVMDLVSPAIVVTLRWQVVTLVLAVIVALILGCIAALKHNTWVDTSTMFVALLGISIPDFALATLLIVVFSLQLGWLPVAGYETPAHFVLPAIILGAGPCAFLSRMVRASMLESIHQDYVTVAKSKGLPQRLIITRHVLRNALLPVVTVIGVMVGRILSGAFVIETIFNIPGIGRVGVTAVLQRDYPVILGVTLILATAFLVTNFFVDVLYGVLDPRIRLTR